MTNFYALERSVAVGAVARDRAVAVPAVVRERVVAPLVVIEVKEGAAAAAKSPIILRSDGSIIAITDKNERVRIKEGS
jgi:hypothetical protein